MTRYAVIVPTNRPERIKQFVAAWEPQFHNGQVRLIVVEDAPTWTIDLLPEWVEHRCWLDIDRELGDRASCIPTRSGGIRDFGFYLAGQDESIDMIVSLDDDVLPIEGVGFLAEHWRMLETRRPMKWWQPVHGFRLRGEPYSAAAVKPMLNVGLWTGFPDIDAITQLNEPNAEAIFNGRMTAQLMSDGRLVPPGMYFPACGMNVAFRREVAPYYYFPKLPDGMKRWDDIWAGLIFKRLADVFEWAVTCGWPILRHERASDPLNNLRQEFLGYGINEEFWKEIDRPIQPKHDNPLVDYYILIRRIAEVFPQLGETAEQMKIWFSLWDGSKVTLPEDMLPTTRSELPAITLTGQDSLGIAGTGKGAKWRGDSWSIGCMHGGSYGVLEKGVYGEDGRGRPVEYDWQCSMCKRWFPKEH